MFSSWSWASVSIPVKLFSFCQTATHVVLYGSYMFEPSFRSTRGCISLSGRLQLGCLVISCDMDGEVSAYVSSASAPRSTPRLVSFNSWTSQYSNESLTLADPFVASAIMDDRTSNNSGLRVFCLELTIGWDDFGHDKGADGLILQKGIVNDTFERIGMFHGAPAEFFDGVESRFVRLV